MLEAGLEYNRQKDIVNFEKVPKEYATHILHSEHGMLELTRNEDGKISMYALSYIKPKKEDYSKNTLEYIAVELQSCYLEYDVFFKFKDKYKDGLSHFLIR